MQKNKRARDRPLIFLCSYFFFFGSVTQLDMDALVVVEGSAAPFRKLLAKVVPANVLPAQGIAPVQAVGPPAQVP